MKSEKLKVKNYKTHNINNLKNLNNNNFNNFNKLNNFKPSFTLIEAIFVIVILSFVLIGGFQILSKLYVRNYIAKQTSKFEFISQQTLDQLSEMLYFRVPLSVIGYNQQTGEFKFIGEITQNENYPILEWIGYLNDAMRDANLSGFIDLYASKKPVIKALDFNSGFINEILKNKYVTSEDLTSLTGIIFAGSFDRGSENTLNDYDNAFGWHGNEAKQIFRINSYTQIGNDCNLSLKNADGTDINHITVYEKFYLVDSAYAIALKKDLESSKWNCKDLNWDDIKDSDLLLFYNYRPWLGETFCGDGGEGNVTLLAGDVKAFKIKKVNYHLMLKLELFKNKADINISVSKQKVAF
jgi:type II secretory pathway pseudopilin PulG